MESRGEYFEGFDWPVPSAFASAVSACRFEQGDVLYSDARAYRAWRGSAPKIEHQIQVLDPPKTTRALAGEGEGKRFFANWGSPVEIEWTARRDPAPRILKTTQGRLFTCLWRGDVERLEENSEAPTPPALQRDLHKALAESEAAFRREFKKLASPGAPHCLYIAALDRASESSCLKARNIRVALEEAFEVSHLTLSPAAADVACEADFHPALSLQGVRVATADAAAIEARLKSLLYAPSARHGLLLEAAD